jgi:branched-chain amino acid transport system ATP-binding protein
MEETKDVTSATILSVENVSKSFRGLRAVSEVSLEVRQDEIVGLIGPNGAGKTTLFNLISGFLQPDAGRIAFEGRSLIGLKPNRVCRLGLARTFQIVKPFGNLTVLENVAVGAFNRAATAAEAEDKAGSVLKFIGLDHKALSPAHSLTTPDRKRLELGRALASSPRLLLLDEVMAGLNPREKGDVTELVRKIRASGVAVLIIEHAMRVIMGLSDRVCVLNYGECIASGDTAAVCSNPRVIEAYIGVSHADRRSA